MNTTELILDRMVHLPESLRTEVLDFIKFLMSKYQVVVTQEQDKITEYDRLFASLLANRGLFECKKCNKLRDIYEQCSTNTDFCKSCFDESSVLEECQCEDLGKRCDLCKQLYSKPLEMPPFNLW